MTGKIEIGRLDYTSNAFNQDAELAMGGDIVRALIELITNADDAYGDNPGEIRVRVESTPDGETCYSVSDEAGGLSGVDLKRCFGTLGGQSSGFYDGRIVRGLFGRGAKDTAVFGRTRFESIHAGSYSWFEISQNADTQLSDPVPAETKHFKDLGLNKENGGMRVTVITRRVRMRKRTFHDLVTKLSRTVQLRDITRQRDVHLACVTGPILNQGLVRWESPPSDLLIEQSISVKGYPDANVQVQLFKLRERVEGKVNHESDHGLEIAGTKAVFSNESFGLGNEQGFGLLRGRIQCSYIEHLVRDYDSSIATGSPSTENPTRILRRDRSGLDSHHPFVVSLREAVAGLLLPILQDLRPKSAVVEASNRLREDLRSAERRLAQILQQDLDEVESDPSESPTLDGELHLRVVPPEFTIQIGGNRHVSVLVRESLLRLHSPVASSRDPSVISCGTLGNFRPHARIPGVLIGTLKITAIGIGVGEAVVGFGEIHARIRVRVVKNSDVPTNVPVKFEWESTSGTCTLNKPRHFVLWAPCDPVSACQVQADLRLEGDGIKLADSHVVLELSSRGFLEAKVRVVGEVYGATANLVAESAIGTAKLPLRVVQHQGNSGPTLSIRPCEELSTGAHRGRVTRESGGLLVEYFVHHTTLSQLLGNKQSDGGWEHENTLEVRSVIAEVVAGLLADYLVALKFEPVPSMSYDADSVLSDRIMRMSKYLRVASEALRVMECEQ